MRRLLPLLILIAVTFAAPMSISFNYANDTYFNHGTHTFTTTITNDAAVNDTFDVDIYSYSTGLAVNGTSSYFYRITNITAGGSNTESVTIEFTNDAKFNEEFTICADVYDLNGTNNRSCLNFRTPSFNSIDSSLSYTPSDDATATLTVNATLSNGNMTTRFNTTYNVYNSSQTCAIDTVNTTTMTIDFENCTSGVYDILVQGVADGYMRSNTFNKFYLIRNITFTASFFVIEQFGYERPIDELYDANERVVGGSSIRVYGRVFYDDGTVISYPPDDYRNYPINLTEPNWNISETTRADSTGNYTFNFIAPQNTSDYTVTLKAYGKYGLVSTIEYTLNINNTKSYAPEAVNSTQILGNLNMTLANHSMEFENNALILDILVSNNNNISVTGKPILTQTNQFEITAAPSDSILGYRERSYPLTIKPRKYTAPGTYDVTLSFTTIYGESTQSIQLIVPEESIEEDKLNVFRYIDYSDDSKVSIRFVNRLEGKADITIRETISKEILPIIFKIEDLMLNCAANEFECGLNYVLNNGSCSDCSLVGGNLTTNCTLNCTNRTSVRFTPQYTRMINADPVVEWDLDVAAGAEATISYLTGLLVEENWMNELNYSATVAGVPVVTATPTPTPTPEPTATPTAIATTVPTSKPPSPGIPWWVFLIIGLFFLLFVAIAAVIAYLFMMKRDAVDSFINKYTEEQPPSLEDTERERIRNLFVTDKPKPPKEELKKAQPKKQPETKKKDSLLNKLDKKLSPKEKEKAPEKYVTSEKTDKQIKELKEIGKGFGDHL